MCHFASSNSHPTNEELCEIKEDYSGKSIVSIIKIPFGILLNSVFAGACLWVKWFFRFSLLFYVILNYALHAPYARHIKCDWCEHIFICSIRAWTLLIFSSFLNTQRECTHIHTLQTLGSFALYTDPAVCGFETNCRNDWLSFVQPLIASSHLSSV